MNKEDPEVIAVSKFKATCLALLKKVHSTRRPLLVTRNGEPLAYVLPPPEPEEPSSWLGSFAGTGKIVGDIVSPASDPDDWSALE